MFRILVFPFSIASYSIFLLVFVYLLAFLGNLQTTALADVWPGLESWIPYSIDLGRDMGSFTHATLINVGLIALFGLQHTVMARQSFKRIWTRLVSAEAERSVYVLLSSLVLAFVMWQWRPIPTPALWHADAAWSAAIGWLAMGAGIVILLWSTFLIDHFDLFGLKQAWGALRQDPARAPRFMTPMLYKFVRHPLYVGWFLIFWSTPSMTAGHLLLAVGMSGYILIAIQYEERDLVSLHGEAYERYREQVPMLVPRTGRGPRLEDSRS